MLKKHNARPSSFTRDRKRSQEITRQYSYIINSLPLKIQNSKFKISAPRDAPGFRTPPSNPVTCISRLDHQARDPPSESKPPPPHPVIPALPHCLLHDVLAHEPFDYPLPRFSKLLDQELSLDDGLPAQPSAVYSSMIKASCTDWSKPDWCYVGAMMLQGL